MIVVKIMKTLGWLCFALLMILIFLVAVGSSNAIFPDSWAKPILIGTVIVSFGLIFGASAVNWFLNQRILIKGTEAEAKILRISSTGERTDKNPVLDFTLEVRSSIHSCFTATARQLIKLENVPSFQPGQYVYVKFIPGREKAVITGSCPQPTESLWTLASNVTFTDDLPAQIPGPIGILLKGLIPVIFVAGIIGFIAFIFLYAPKLTEEYSCAMSELTKNPQALALLGSPVEAGLIATGNFGLTSTGRNAHFTTSVRGAKGSGILTGKAFRDEVLGSNLRLTLEMNGRKIELYNAAYPCR